MQEPSSSFVTQPFTSRGVAAFAYASFGRLALFQLLTAVVAAAAVLGFFEIAWVPVLKRAIAALPSSGAIRQGCLGWKPADPVQVSGSSFLWISVDPTDSLDAGEGPDLQIEFGKYELRLRSLLGISAVPYPAGYIISLNRTELEPWWGAWHPPVAVGLGVGVVLWLFVSWTALALLYCWPVRMIAFYADRRLSWAGAWRLAAAALLPGALFLVLAILAYTFNQIRLVQLIFATALHFLIPWGYLLTAPFCLARVPEVANRPGRKNPFSDPKPKRKNPFTDASKKGE